MTETGRSRRARLRTTVEDPATVVAAIRPDNTDEMTTTIEDGAVHTTIDRETTGGLQSTVDDYVVNLDVATQVIEIARHHATDTASGEDHTDGESPHGQYSETTTPDTTPDTTDQQ